MKFLQALILNLVFVSPNLSMAQNKSTAHIDWKILATLPVPAKAEKQLGLAGPVSGVHNDVLIVGGGANFPAGMPWMGGSKKYYRDVYIFTRNQDAQVNSSPKMFKLPYPAAYGASCSTPQGVVYAGGESEHGLTKKVFLIQWNSEAENISIKNLPDLPTALANASLSYSHGKLFLVGGETGDSVSSDFLELDLNQDAKEWRTLPALPKPVSHSVVVASDQGVYVIGGRKRNPGAKSDLYSSVYYFDLQSGQWMKKSPLPYCLSAGTGLATEKNGILIFGGDKGETFHKTEALIAEISREEDYIRRDELNRKKMELQSAHPGFSRDILKFDTGNNKWSVIGAIPFEAPVTTTAVQWGDSIIIPSGEVKAGVRTSHILSATLSKD